MAIHSRRSWIKKNIAIAAAGAALPMLPRTAHAARHGNLQLSMHLNLRNPERLKICKQLGVTHVITGAPFYNIPRDQYAAAKDAGWICRSGIQNCRY